MIRTLSIVAGATFAAALAIAGLTLAGEGGTSATRSGPPPETFGVAEVIRHDLGAKRMVGYFVRVDGACRLTLVVGEEARAGAPAPSPARITVSLRPGQRADLASQEIEGMILSCGPEAKTMQVVRAGPARS